MASETPMPTLTTLIIYGDAITDKLKDAAALKNVKCIGFTDVSISFFGLLEFYLTLLGR